MIDPQWPATVASLTKEKDMAHTTQEDPRRHEALRLYLDGLQLRAAGREADAHLRELHAEQLLSEVRSEPQASLLHKVWAWFTKESTVR